MRDRQDGKHVLVVDDEEVETILHLPGAGGDQG